MALTSTTAIPTHQFDQATLTTFLGRSATNSVCYKGRASEEWAVGNVPNGGKTDNLSENTNTQRYVVSIILDSVLQHYRQRYQKHPVSLSCNFFGKTLPGGVIIEIEELKVSNKGYCVCQAVLKQYKDPNQELPSAIDDFNADNFISKVHGIFTMGNMEEETGKTYYHKNPQPPSREALVPTKYLFMGDFVNAKVDPSTFPRSSKTGKPVIDRTMVLDEDDVILNGEPELTQAMSFADGRPVDLKSMAYWSDMFIALPFLLGTTYWNGLIWCPTMTMEILFKRVPKTSEVLAHFNVPHIINNRFDLDGEIFDTDGNILAVTKHQCLVVDWTRNTSSKL